MKAREWYAKLKGAPNQEQYEKVLDNCLRSLVQDADSLIKIRKATSDKAVAACIDEVNNKWLAILNMRESDTAIPPDHHMMKSKLVRDGFKAAYVYIHPNKGWYFDMKRHKVNMEHEQMKFMGLDLTKPVLILFGLTPYDKMENFTMDDLRREFLHAAYALGNISKSCASWPQHVVAVYSKILARHMFLINTWITIGRVNVEDVNEDDTAIMEKYGVTI